MACIHLFFRGFRVEFLADGGEFAEQQADGGQAGDRRGAYLDTCGVQVADGKALGETLEATGSAFLETAVHKERVEAEFISEQVGQRTAVQGDVRLSAGDGAERAQWVDLEPGWLVEQRHGGRRERVQRQQAATQAQQPAGVVPEQAFLKNAESIVQTIQGFACAVFGQRQRLNPCIARLPEGEAGWILLQPGQGLGFAGGHENEPGIGLRLFAQYGIRRVHRIVHVMVQPVGEAHKAGKQQATGGFQRRDLPVHRGQLVAGGLFAPFRVGLAAFPGRVAELRQQHVARPVPVGECLQFVFPVQRTVVQVEHPDASEVRQQRGVVEIAADDFYLEVGVDRVSFAIVEFDDGEPETADEAGQASVARALEQDDDVPLTQDVAIAFEEGRREVIRVLVAEPEMRGQPENAPDVAIGGFLE